MGRIGCSEKSVSNYHYTLRNNTEERSYQLLGSGSLKSGIRPMLLGYVFTALRVSVLLSVAKSNITVIVLEFLFLFQENR